MNTTTARYHALSNIVSLALGSVMLIGMSLVTPRGTAHAAEGAALHVQLNDLDLNSQSGLKQAYQRVRKAARSVCQRVSEPEDIGRGIHIAECIDATLKQADASVAQLAQTQQSQLAQNTSR